MHHDGAKPRILIVDDNPRTIDLLLRQLRRHGYDQVSTAQSAQEALDRLAMRPVDAVMVDLDLPPLGGRSLLQHVRTSACWSGLPVLVVTSRRSAPSIRTAAQEGASGFVHQPFYGVEIIFKIEQAVRDSRARAAELVDLTDARDPGAASDDRRPAGSRPREGRP